MSLLPDQLRMPGSWMLMCVALWLSPTVSLAQHVVLGLSFAALVYESKIAERETPDEPITFKYGMLWLLLGLVAFQIVYWLL